MEQQYKTDAEIYAVLEREIIDLTIRPGSSLSENPLCARFGAPRSLIRVVLQKLQENAFFNCLNEDLTADGGSFHLEDDTGAARPVTADDMVPGLCRPVGAAGRSLFHPAQHRGCR